MHNGKRGNECIDFTHLGPGCVNARTACCDHCCLLDKNVVVVRRCRLVFLDTSRLAIRKCLTKENRLAVG